MPCSALWSLCVLHAMAVHLRSSFLRFLRWGSAAASAAAPSVPISEKLPTFTNEKLVSCQCGGGTPIANCGRAFNADFESSIGTG